MPRYYLLGVWLFGVVGGLKSGFLKVSEVLFWALAPQCIIFAVLLNLLTCMRPCLGDTLVAALHFRYGHERTYRSSRCTGMVPQLNDINSRSTAFDRERRPDDEPFVYRMMSPFCSHSQFRSHRGQTSLHEASISSNNGPESVMQYFFLS